MTDEYNSETRYQVSVNDETYTVAFAEASVLDIKFRIERYGEYVCTLGINDEGNWQAEAGEITESLVDKLGRAIEEHDGR